MVMLIVAGHSYMCGETQVNELMTELWYPYGVVWDFIDPSAVYQGWFALPFSRPSRGFGPPRAVWASFVWPTAAG